MVEPNPPSNQPRTQLPAATTTTAAVELEPEETKETSQFMYGNDEDFANDVKARLEDVEMNPLEAGLLDRHLQDPRNCRTQII